MVGQVIPDKSVIAAFCPLADFPSKLLASQDATIRTLREPNKYAMVHALMSHLATKLNVLLDERLGVTLTLKDGETVRLHPECVTFTEVMPGAVIHFVCEGVKYKLFPDPRPPSLSMMIVRDGKELGWTECELK